MQEAVASAAGAAAATAAAAAGLTPEQQASSCKAVRSDPLDRLMFLLQAAAAGAAAADAISELFSGTVFRSNGCAGSCSKENDEGAPKHVRTPEEQALAAGAAAAAAIAAAGGTLEEQWPAQKNACLACLTPVLLHVVLTSHASQSMSGILQGSRQLRRLLQLQDIPRECWGGMQAIHD